MALHKLLFIIIFSLARCFVTLADDVSTKELKIVSPHWDGYRREVEVGFNKWYRQKYNSDIAIRWIDIGGGSDIVRNLVARKNIGDPLPVDIVFGGGTDIFDSLKKAGLLVKTDLPNNLRSELQNYLGGNKLIDEDDTWFSVSLTTFGIVINKKVLTLKGIKEPKFYSDLADESFRQLVGSADPRKSGTNRFMYELILQKYGWEQGWRLIYKISSNVKSFSVHSSQSPKDVASGEIAVALLVDSYAQEIIRKYGNEKIVYNVPLDTYSFFGDPIAKLITVADSKLADRFIEYILSTDGQSIISLKVGAPNGPIRYELTRLPVNKAMYSLANLARDEKPFEFESTFTYRQDEAASRWDVTSKLLGIFAVDIQPMLYEARYIHGLDLSNLAPPVTLQELSELNELTKLQGVNSLIVDSKIRYYRDRFIQQLPKASEKWWIWLVICVGIIWLISLIKDILFKYANS